MSNAHTRKTSPKMKFTGGNQSQTHKTRRTEGQNNLTNKPNTKENYFCKEKGSGLIPTLKLSVKLIISYAYSRLVVLVVYTPTVYSLNRS